MGQPRRNERRFYRYPLHRIVAVVDDAVGGDQERQRVLDVLRARAGHHLLHFRRWTIEEIRQTAHDHHGEHDG
jgi:hypothetical protein